jgi:soluble lytic murein transglycosylase-like protein
VAAPDFRAARFSPAPRPPGPTAQARPAHAPAAALEPFEHQIRAAARAAGVGANWLRAVILQESAGDPAAVSRRGAVGLMQLLPATAAALGVRDPFEPAQNVLGGARYLRTMLDRYGDPRLALAAYNAGPGRVEAYGGVPPFRETRAYVERVLALKQTFDRLWPADAGTPGGR